MQKIQWPRIAIVVRSKQVSSQTVAKAITKSASDASKLPTKESKSAGAPKSATKSAPITAVAKSAQIPAAAKSVTNTAAAPNDAPITAAPKSAPKNVEKLQLAQTRLELPTVGHKRVQRSRRP